MYIAYSEVLRDNVNINAAFDLNEVFCCPNKYCTAKFKIKGATGKRAKHFFRLSSTPHIEGCDYENGDSRYEQPSLQIRSTLEEILGDNVDPSTKSGRPSKGKETRSSSNMLCINTPRKLLKFCRINSLKTEYSPGIKVNDIILDERNLLNNENYKGINGVRLVVGETVKYSGNKLYMVTKATSRYGSTKYLNTIIEIDSALFQKIKKYIIETQNGTFKGFKLAVFGVWRKDKDYWSFCAVYNQKNIILNV